MEYPSGKPMGPPIIEIYKMSWNTENSGLWWGDVTVEISKQEAHQPPIIETSVFSLLLQSWYAHASSVTIFGLYIDEVFIQKQMGFACRGHCSLEMVFNTVTV